MKFIAIKTDDGTIKGKLAFYCRMLHVSRQGFYKYLSVKDRPWKYQTLADTMLEIHAEDVCNDTYGRVRMFQALTLKRPDGIPIPSERTVYRVMEKIGLSHRPKRNPKGITKADREARKSDDLLKRNFTSEKPLEKCVTDITEIKAKDGKLYVSAIFDCFDSAVLGLAMETTMKATLCQHTVENAFIAYPEIRGAVLHSDRGSQYTSELYRSTLRKYEIIQSMNSAGGRCHDNARCESMWARLKTELLYDRYNSENLTVSELKSLIWRYFISYWNNRRICTTNGGLPPMLKRQRYYDSLRIAAQSMMSLRKMCQPILTTSVYSHRLKKERIFQSMSRKGNCLDNSVMENFFGLLKQEIYYGVVYYSYEELKSEIERFIKYYNEKRIKEKLGWMSPVQYRLHLLAA